MSIEDQAMKRKRVTFTVHAPGAENVYIAGSFNEWNVSSDPLNQSKKDMEDGTWRRSIFLEPGVYEYRFIVDGIWQNDGDTVEGRTNEFGSVKSVIWV